MEVNTLNLMLEMGIPLRCTVFSGCLPSEGVQHQRQLLVAFCACSALQTAASVAQGSLDTAKPRHNPCLKVGNGERRRILLKSWCSWWFVNAMGYECDGK